MVAVDSRAREAARQQNLTLDGRLTFTRTIDLLVTRRIQTYPVEGITVTFDSNICTHSGVCVRGLRAVFDVSRRDWVHADAAPAEVVAAQIDRCPSGALQYTLPSASTSDDPIK